MKINFGYITPVPLNTELIDTSLSKTQRRTPTVIHPQYNIIKIRMFYMRKVKHAGSEFGSRLGTILTDFPRIEDIHPFYRDLINVLYDRDHYKLALGHVNSARNAIDKISKEFVKLLKFADSLYRCKQLKRAALGRMASAIKRLGKTLEYLEEVRMHMSRLPSIDLSGRTLLVCGFPNVGKSSFVRKVSRADVEVQSYPFTTKSLYVGHFDYKYLQWQVIDTPGILDQPLENRNTIEMLSITALAHIKAVVLYFIDLSETCGYSISEQIDLFNTLNPLLNSSMVIVLSKSDVVKLCDLEDKEMIMEFLSGKKYMEMSCEKEENIDVVKGMACDLLLDERFEKKINSDKLCEYINRITILRPKEVREKAESFVCSREITEIENEQERYLVPSEYKYDIIPEIIDGKNVADFFDPDIERKLVEIEKEEEDMLPMYCKTYDVLSPEERALKEEITVGIERRRIINRLREKKRLPDSWKLRTKNSGEEVEVSVKKDNKTQIVQPPRQPSKKKARFDDKHYYDRKPKHLYRGRR
ncbi:NOG1 nucleolar GTP-binding protein [Encephalitozoon intestinalis ATCC 50506]|uniref:NOG1 nucleolar GTP-binding protein n=1 Tax=Encephalitozoon intestinalis (strain ATCC 50506) TaxID=876142 RepID=E0S7A2_ENCIT|nr:NOG1 nucleolar GTP-binding protein [Encephalitozoon intestinalis ATCC 50506]ADM11530.1 NOG1 nucleolar GTP-binding protein [Encephalitozoon intestinalis ATCC 50506]UTX45244.1 nucleolar GTP-binding protein [Encephalitozoon intestinalis]